MDTVAQLEEKLTGLSRIEFQKVERKDLYKHLQIISEKIDYLFTHQIKFHVDYLSALNIIKLEIFLIAVNPLIRPERKEGGIEWLLKMNERERRKVFNRAIRNLKLKKMTWEEIKSLRIALGYPAMKPSTFHKNVREAIRHLIKQLKKDLFQ